MNYITNYYKNLSEQLQEQVNRLEKEVKMINEAVASYQTMARPAQMGGPSTLSDRYSVNSGDQYSAEVQGVLSSWGQSNSPYDYNGDGVVDGVDLGLALGGNFGQGGAAMRSTELGGVGQQTQIGGAVPMNTQVTSVGAGRGMRPAGTPGRIPGSSSLRPSDTVTGQYNRSPRGGGGQVSTTGVIGTPNTVSGYGRPTMAGSPGQSPTGSLNQQNTVTGQYNRPTQGGGGGGQVSTTGVIGTPNTVSGYGRPTMAGSPGQSPTGSLNQQNTVTGQYNRPTQGGGGGGQVSTTGVIGTPNTVSGYGRPTMAGSPGQSPIGSLNQQNTFTGQYNRPTQGGGGSSPTPGDLNGDGVVDGADLGLALGGQGGGDFQSVLQNWGIPTPQGVPSTRMTQQRRRRVR